MCLLGAAVIVWATTAATAQHFNFKTYTTSEGLPQNVVFSLLQDESGRLWIGTTDGLSRYDGARFETFGRENGLTNSRVYTIVPDGPDAVLVGTRQGVTRIDVTGGRREARPIVGTAECPLDDVAAIVRTPGGRWWFGTSAGLVAWDGRSLSRVPWPADHPAGPVLCGLGEADGTLWFGVAGEVVRVRDADGRPAFTFFGKDQGVTAERIRGLWRDPDGALWAAGMGGVFRGTGDPLRFQRFGRAEGFPADIAYAVRRDTDGLYWASTNEGAVKFAVAVDAATGAARLAVRRLFQERNGLCNNKVVPLLIDRESNVWLGTHGGLAKIESERFALFDDRDGLPKGAVSGLAVDRTGAVWIGTDGGLAVLADDRVTNLTATHRELARGVACVRTLDDGRAIAALDGGTILELSRSAGGTVRARVLATGDIHKLMQVYGIIQDGAGDIWVGGLRGLARFDRNGRFLKTYTAADGLTATTVYEFGRGRADELWIGTNGGLSRMTRDPDGTPSFSAVPGLEGCAGKTIGPSLRDSTGTDWIATEGDGVLRWDGKTLSSVTTANGLSNNVVNQIFESPAGTLWFATNKGIDRLRDGKIVRFGYEEGFSQRGTDARAVVADGAGTLWVATRFGVVRYVPTLDRSATALPKLEIEAVRLDGELRSEVGNLAVGAGGHTLEFSLLGISLTDEARVRYRWKLDGIDADWQPPAAGRLVRYQNLPPGTYRFVATAINAGGLESAPVAFGFSIARPLWQRPWFLALSLIAVAAAGWGGHRVRIAVLETQKRDLERVVAQRTAELARSLDETERKNAQLAEAKGEVDRKNRELDGKVAELEAAQRQADRIFSALAEALPGTVLDGKYRLDEKIGAGGFGMVFRGRHLALDRPIAVKVFRPLPGNDTTDAVERFRREGIAACRVTHPNAVAVMDSGISSDGIAFIVMELLAGGTLAEELRRVPCLSLRRTVEIVVPVCETLDAAHAAGIIHRDIKPDNIFLHRSAEGEIVKVVDFGIAKLAGTEDRMESLTRTGGIVGTPDYIAPERLNGGTYDGRADVYSLGIVVYQMLCGRVPFENPGGNLVSLILSHLNEPPPPIRLVRPDLPRDIEIIVIRALAKKPEDRPSAGRFAAELRAAAAMVPEDIATAAPSVVARRSFESAHLPTTVMSEAPTVSVPGHNATLHPQGATEGKVDQDEIETLVPEKSVGRDIP